MGIIDADKAGQNTVQMQRHGKKPLDVLTLEGGIEIRMRVTNIFQILYDDFPAVQEKLHPRRNQSNGKVLEGVHLRFNAGSAPFMRIVNDPSVAAVVAAFKNIAAIRMVLPAGKRDSLLNSQIGIAFFKKYPYAFEQSLLKFEFLLDDLLLEHLFRDVGRDLHMERAALMPDELVLDEKVPVDLAVVKFPDIKGIKIQLRHRAEGTGLVEPLKELMAFMLPDIFQAKGPHTVVIDPEQFVRFGIIDINNAVKRRGHGTGQTGAVPQRAGMVGVRTALHHHSGLRHGACVRPESRPRQRRNDSAGWRGKRL